MAQKKKNCPKSVKSGRNYQNNWPNLIKIGWKLASKFRIWQKMIEKYSISIQMTKFVQYQLKKLPKIGQFWSKLAKNWTNWMKMGWKSTSKFRIL